MGRLTDSTQLGYKEKYGADSFLARRSEVRSELFCLATCASAELQIQSDPAKMVFESGPVDVDPGQGFVTLEDGSEVHGDLVNSELGLRLNKVAYFLQADIETVADGIQQACMEVGELSGGWHSDIDGKGILNFTQTLHGKHRMMVSYPLSKFQHFNISLLRPAREGLGNEESSWHADANRDVMLDDFRYFDESLVRMMTCVKDILE